MNRELLEIIKQYQDAVANMFPKLVAHLGIKTLISNDALVSLGVDQVGKTPCGILYFIHGHGVKMNDGTTKVDFDLGGKGQIDGVDAWKLADFIKDNKIESSLTGKRIENEIRVAVSAGDMECSDYPLYYLT